MGSGNSAWWRHHFPQVPDSETRLTTVGDWLRRVEFPSYLIGLVYMSLKEGAAPNLLERKVLLEETEIPKVESLDI